MTLRQDNQLGTSPVPPRSSRLRFWAYRLRHTHGQLAWLYLSSRLGARRQRKTFASVRTYATFIGNSRNGTSILGTLLNAHRHVVMAQELDAMRYVAAGFSAPQIFDLLIRRDRQFALDGRVWKGDNHTIADQHQGRFEDLQVIGDAMGGRTTFRIGRDPALLDRLRAALGKRQLRVFHVVRNPFDNISSIARVVGLTMHEAADRYFTNCQTNVEIMQRLDASECMEIHHDALITDPGATVEAMCTFLGIDCPADYRAACADIVHPASRRARDSAEWTGDLMASVHERLGSFEYLSSYRFDD